MPSNIYIVLVNYNSSEDTIECIQSVFNSTHTNFQIIVVDNSTTTEHIDAIYEWGIKNHDNSLRLNSICKIDEEAITPALQEKIILVKSKKITDLLRLICGCKNSIGVFVGRWAYLVFE